jgi:hydroxymethylpyrimidine/phosphomethylpyrimidine kinase
MMPSQSGPNAPGPPGLGAARPGPSLPVALTIAGSDSGGGAGIQADLKTFHAFGVFGTSALTALTAQDTTGVRSVHPVPLQMVRDQVDAVVEDLSPGAIKTGMLATAELVEVVAGLVEAHGLGAAFVLDPVMVATSGDRLLDKDAEGAVAERLLPLAAVVTPNLDEARILTGLPVVGESGQREAARALVKMGAGAALVKGGHGEDEELVDILFDGTRERVWRRPRIRTRSTHGTGCTLSAGIAAGLALGDPLEVAVDRALDFVARAIAAAPGLGRGNGPVNHFVQVAPRPE